MFEHVNIYSTVEKKRALLNREVTQLGIIILIIFILLSFSLLSLLHHQLHPNSSTLLSISIFHFLFLHLLSSIFCIIILTSVSLLILSITIILLPLHPPFLLSCLHHLHIPFPSNLPLYHHLLAPTTSFHPIHTPGCIMKM